MCYFALTNALELGKRHKNNTDQAKPEKLPLVILPFAENAESLLPQLSVHIPGLDENLLMQFDLSSNQTSVVDINCEQSLDGIQKSCRSAPTYLYS